MAACEKFIAWIVRMFKRYRAWRKARVAKWEDRYIIQYEQQIADAVAGIEEAKQRRAQAASR